MSDQDTLMQYDPVTGEPRPYPSHAQQWREYHGNAAWLVDPWNGNARNAYDIGSDPFGLLIIPNPGIKVTTRKVYVG